MNARAIGLIFFGWGLLLAISSVWVVPWLQARIGTVSSILLGTGHLFDYVIMTPVFLGKKPVAIFASQAFTFSGDTCTAKQGAATTGSCSLLETVDLTVVAGDLKMSKEAGNVAMSGVSLGGTDQASTGDLKDVTVMDYRGGTLGWSLVGRFSGLTGPAKPSGGNFTISPDAMSWTPSCAAQSNSDDTVVAGAAGSFTDASTDLPLCAVATSGLGANGISGGDAVADAGLSVEVGAGQAAGTYTGLLTLTLS